MPINIIPERAILKIARMKQSTNTSGVYTLLLKVPGSEGRVISGGQGWFESPHKDDYVEIHITDEDNILGGGAGEIVGGYTDTEVPTDNQGWYVLRDSKMLDFSPIESSGFAQTGLWLKIIATTGDSRENDTFRCNIKWGER